MPTLTPRLGLEKPLGNELVRRQVINNNYDIIDRNAAKRDEQATLLENRTGTAAVAGDVVVIDTANPRSFVIAPGLNARGYVGVVAEAIGNNATGLVVFSGRALIKVDGAVATGDWLGTSTLARHAKSQGPTRRVGAFAYALAAGSGGTVDALVFSPAVEPEAFPGAIVMTLLSACPEGWSELTLLRGRVPVGVPAGGTIGATVGTPLANQGTRVISEVPSHAHDVNITSGQESAHTHGVGSLAVGNEAGHIHNEGTYTVLSEASHTHGSGGLGTGGADHDHNHSITLNTGGPSVNHTHSISLTTSNSGAHTHGLYANPPGQTTAHGLEYRTNYNGPYNDLMTGAGNHTHTISGSTAYSTDNHTHTIIGGTNLQSQQHTHPMYGTTAAGSSHTHHFNGSSGPGISHSHGLSGSTAAGAAHTHAVVGTTATAGIAAVDVTMPYVQVRYCVKD